MDKDERIKQYIKVLLEEREKIKTSKDLISEASSLASNESLSINKKGIEDDISNINNTVDKVLKVMNDCIEKYNRV